MKILPREFRNRRGGTTLRTWMVFTLFFLFAIALCAATILSIFWPFADLSGRFGPALQLFEALAFATMLQGSIYTGKRAMEHWTQGKFRGAQPPVRPFSPHDMEDK
ncbi:hypothetical protein [Leptonema illini]|uniref:Uncharacterized protein n=1 Tax=Leptonema illini DSM 21528 TaxID=929563 RepID=H2CL45_9LEPT|nr:hypothetical protein [Leptonema illini]EHQ08296.1 hypothetical protein Lepil_3639 [Leptonema illini DSM 21528]